MSSPSFRGFQFCGSFRSAHRGGQQFNLGLANPSIGMRKIELNHRKFRAVYSAFGGAAIMQSLASAADRKERDVRR